MNLDIYIALTFAVQNCIVLKSARAFLYAGAYVLALLVIGFSASTSKGRESFQVCELSKAVLSIISFALENGRVPAVPHAVPISPHIHEAVGFRR
jgi:hypothetical protein